MRQLVRGCAAKSGVRTSFGSASKNTVRTEEAHLELSIPNPQHAQNCGVDQVSQACENKRKVMTIKMIQMRDRYAEMFYKTLGTILSRRGMHMLFNSFTSLGVMSTTDCPR